jgi:Tol biopolymer transport system component
MLDVAGDATVTHLRMLTPDYASPEQMSGGIVGTSSDIYSLGAVLRHLLTGKAPGETPYGELPPELKGDLGIILQTAMRREPDQRYATVEDFAADLKAYLDSHPIRARHQSHVYRLRKFVGRYWLSVALTGAVAIAFMTAGVLAWYWSRSAGIIADLRPQRLTANTPELPILAAALSPDGRSVAYSDALGIHLRDTASGETRLLPQTRGHVLVQWMPDSSGLQTRVLDEAGGTTTMVVSPLGGTPTVMRASDVFKLSPDGKHRAMALDDPQRVVIQDEDRGETRELWRAADTFLYGVHWSPDSKNIAVLSYTRTGAMLETIDITTGRKNVLVPVDKHLSISSVLWAGQDRMIVAIQEKAGANSEGASNLWEIRLNAGGTSASDKLRKLTAWTDFPIRPGSLTTDGKKLIFIRSFRQRDVYIGELDAGRRRMGTLRRLTMDLGDDYPTAWTRDSKTVILTSDRNGPAAIFRQDLNKATADPLVAGPGGQILPRLAPDGKSVLFCSRDRGKRVLMRTPVGGGTAELLFEAPNLADFRCSRAGTCSITERKDGATVVSELDLINGKGREIYRVVTGSYATPDLSPDGKWFATASGTKVVVRSFSTGAVVREIAVRGIPNPNVVTLDYAPDGKGFFAGDTTPTDARQLYIDLSGQASVLWRQAGPLPTWGVPSPDGKYLAMMVYTDDSNVYMLERF